MSKAKRLSRANGDRDCSRAALNRFLKDSGFATRGDLVLVEPSASETREIRRSEKAVVATISTRARDRHGDIVDPAGVRLERYRKNPVVLWAHDYEALPVARSLWERVRESDTHGVGGEGGSELIAKPQFHLDTELSREVWALLEKGVLSAWSVGFLPEEWDIVKLKTARVEDGLAPGGGSEASFVVKKWDLLEYSCVPVPANFEALTHELKARRITVPALVKTLAPLGLKAPDLVCQPVAAPPQPADAARETNASDGPDSSRPLPLRGEASPGEGSGAARRLGRRIPASRGLSTSLLKRAVKRAFERVLRRAWGEGR